MTANRRNKNRNLAAIALEKLWSLVGRSVRVELADGSDARGKLTAIMASGLKIRDGQDSEIDWPHSLVLDFSFDHPLSQIRSIELEASSEKPNPKIVKREIPKETAPAPSRPLKLVKFDGQ